MKKYTVESYTGTNIGRGYMHRVGIQIVCTEDGKRKSVFKTQRGVSPCNKVFECAAHYKTGINKADAVRWQEAWKRAEKECAKLNKGVKNGK